VPLVEPVASVMTLMLIECAPAASGNWPQLHAAVRNVRSGSGWYWPSSSGTEVVPTSVAPSQTSNLSPSTRASVTERYPGSVSVKVNGLSRESTGAAPSQSKYCQPLPTVTAYMILACMPVLGGSRLLFPADARRPAKARSIIAAIAWHRRFRPPMSCLLPQGPGGRDRLRSAPTTR
jgi:hypothetical protein